VLSFAAGAVLLIASALRVEAQPSVFAQDGLRIEWTADLQQDARWNRVCGYIHNQTSVTTREIALMVEGLDGSGQVVERRRISVLGPVSPSGRTYFCSVVAAGAVRYGVSIASVQWGSDR
jgi:hypothetical protein